jgi:hypothetical protein
VLVFSLTIPEVNVLKSRLWNDESEFDGDKDKSQFRDYEAACDRVKAFYKEQHGTSTDTRITLALTPPFRKTNRGIQYCRSRQL